MSIVLSFLLLTNKTTTNPVPHVWQLLVYLSICLCDPLPHIVQRHLWRICRHCVQPLTSSVLLFNCCEFSKSETLLQCSDVIKPSFSLFGMVSYLVNWVKYNKQIILSVCFILFGVLDGWIVLITKQIVQQMHQIANTFL